jgi:DNA-binding NtrC family response regulator
MPKILIIEDDTDLNEGYQGLFADAGIELLIATTLLEALRVFEENPDIVCVFVDGLFPRKEGESHRPEHGRKCNGVIFLINADHRCPMFACSSENAINQQMLNAGATETCKKGTAILVRARQLLKDTAK